MLVRRTPWIAILFLFSLVVSSFGKELSLIYPTDKTMVSRSNFLIIKGGDTPPLEAMTIEINGVVSDPLDVSSAEYKGAFADFLILEPTWSAGKNIVVVKGLVGGKTVATAKADIFYSSMNDPVSILPPGYKPFVMHTAEKEALCAPCHTMQPSDAQLKSATAENNPCASCHKRMFNEKFVHGPEGLFQCSDCHDGKSKPVRWQISKKELDLCGECHTDKIDEIKKNAFTHGPVGVGDCTVCHDPHASNYPAQLVAPTNALCLGCHVNIGKGVHVLSGINSKSHPLDKVPDPGRPGQMLSCTSCHNPHGGAVQPFFRKNITSRFTLCQMCHQK